MEGGDAVGSPFFQWLKPPRSSSPSSWSSSSDSSPSASMAAASGQQVAVLGEEGRAGGGEEEASSMTCLPLLSRLGEGKGADDHHEQCPVKEEIAMSGASSGDLAQSGVDLNIGLPVGGPCIEDAVMEDKDVDEEEEEEEGNEVEEEDDEDEGEEWKDVDSGCKVEGMDQQHEHGEVVASVVEGSNNNGLGEFGVVGAESGLPIGCRYWIPTPAQILIGPVQFICHVCNKTFNRYNNMQVLCDVSSVRGLIYIILDLLASLLVFCILYYCKSIDL